MHKGNLNYTEAYCTAPIASVKAYPIYKAHQAQANFQQHKKLPKLNSESFCDTLPYKIKAHSLCFSGCYSPKLYVLYLRQSTPLIDAIPIIAGTNANQLFT